MMKKNIFLIILFVNTLLFAQGDLTVNNSYPTNYFNSPLDIPLVLSGTFGELRTNHFHAGLDIKTEQREGLNVYAAAEGYVSRIKISLWGYGKAIYITHPNGYTSVYAHLKKFNSKIEDYIKKIQYKKENYEVQVFPSTNELLIAKNELIAFSGATGGFVGPHLHFEIRDTKTEKPINPFYFGITVNDNKKPRVNTLVGYSLNKNSHINKTNIPTQLNLIELENGDLLAPKIEAYGTIGFGINAYDQLDDAYNKNGLYSLQMLLNGEKIYEFKASSFSFSETKYINLLIDYERFTTLKQRVQKCFIEPKNKLSLFNKSLNNGFITIEDGLNYKVEIIAKDFKGNLQKIIIPITGKNDSLVASNIEKITPYKINHNQFNKFSKNGVTVAFPKYTFYNDFYLDFNVKDSVAKIHTPTIPLDKKYTLTFDVSNYSTNKKQKLYIASINEKGKSSYENTVKKEATFYTTTKSLGKYTLLSDNIPPKVQLHNFKNEQWLTNFNFLKLKIADNESGIHTFRGEIDGEWILMEYNLKKGLLTYNLNDKKFNTAKHQLKVTVTDNVGNSTTINAIFYRKK